MQLLSGAEETRILCLIAASDALSQVSYDPVTKVILPYFSVIRHNNSLKMLLYPLSNLLFFGHIK